MAMRMVWKGAISFGLVHIPVALYPASQDSGIDFDWIDKRSMDPVGYKRINKRTGKEIDAKQVVRGVKQDSGDYVILSDEEIKAAYPASTQTIAIEAFVKAQEVAFVFLERPYVLGPLGKGDHVYALLREAMAELGVIGIARVVMHAKEHLCALIAAGPALMLDTLRWANDLRSLDEIDFPPAGKSAAKLKDNELKMARELIGDMTMAWKPESYNDQFADAIHALIKQRVKAGKTTQVQALEEAPGEDATPSNVIDLTELLKRSLARPKAAPARAKKAPAVHKRAPAPRARKTAAR
jgi:DNA end-binding protein Ku